MAKRTNKSSQKRQPHLKKENDAIIDDHSEFSPTPSKGIRKAKMPKLPKDLEKKTDWNAIITPLSQLSENIDYKTNPFVEGSKYGTFFMWLKKGIYKIEGSTRCGPVYQWDEFEVREIFVNSESNEEYYHVRFNGGEYSSISLKILRELIIEKAYVQGNRGVFNRLFTIYLQKFAIPRKLSSLICGFSEQGWRLPPEYTFPRLSNGIGRECLKGIEQILSIEIESQTAMEYFRALYEGTTIKYRDILFSFAIVMPFEYVLKKFIGLQPFLALGSGSGGGKGKTSFAKAMTTKIWWNLGGKEVLSVDNVESISRLIDYFSASTFPIVIDDSATLGSDIIKILKSHCTASTNAERKNVNQELQSNKTLLSSPIFTFNEFPEWFHETAMEERGMYLDFSSEPPNTEAQANRWREAYNCIPEGYLGQYLIEQTKDWAIETIKAKYDQQPSMTKGTDRENVLFKLTNLGASLIEEWFDLRLNLEGLEELIRNSAMMVHQALISDVISQLTADFRWNSDNSNFFHSTDTTWIKNRVEKQEDGNGIYYAYTSENLLELQQKHKGEYGIGRLSLPSLCEMLNKVLSCDCTKQRASWRELKPSINMLRIYKADLDNYLGME